MMTRWTVWCLFVNSPVWLHLVDEAGGPDAPRQFDSLEAAEAVARGCTDDKGVIEVEVREERSVLSFPGAAHKTTKR